MAPASEQTSVPAYAERLAWLEAQEVETPAEQRGRGLAIVILILGIIVDMLFGVADRAIRRRWGLTGTV